MTDNKILEVSLELQNIDDLFKKPAISPLSSAYQEYSYQAGLEFVADDWRKRHQFFASLTK